MVRRRRRGPAPGRARPPALRPAPAPAAAHFTGRALERALSAAQDLGRLGHDHSFTRPRDLQARPTRAAAGRCCARRQSADDFLEMHAHDRIDAAAEARMRVLERMAQETMSMRGLREMAIGIWAGSAGCRLCHRHIVRFCLATQSWRLFLARNCRYRQKLKHWSAKWADCSLPTRFGASRAS